MPETGKQGNSFGAAFSGLVFHHSVYYLFFKALRFSHVVGHRVSKVSMGTRATLEMFRVLPLPRVRPL